MYRRRLAIKDIVCSPRRNCAADMIRVDLVLDVVVVAALDNAVVEVWSDVFIEG